MTSNRRDHPSLTIPLSASATTLPELPPIDALFLIDFDVKAGYTIAWKRTAPDVVVNDAVEYKSLPSGLHTVSEDLIYFVHDDAHAGLSAFVNIPVDEEEARNARMIAVGVLVPLSYGRLGRAWRHAQGLKDLAESLAKDRKDTDLLEKYWEANRLKKDADSQPPPVAGETPTTTPAVTFSEPPPSQTGRKGHTRNRSASDGGSLAPAEHKLSPYHPAWSLTTLLDKFGPLIFPIQRAALLRQRILISTHAPVHEVCDFGRLLTPFLEFTLTQPVYNLSVLSNIPLSLSNILRDQSPTHRLRPLFTIGVHDVPFLTADHEASKRREQGSDTAIDDDDEAGSGWIACTTDSILAMKDTLWDMLITMPPEHSVNAKDKVWPTVECPRGQPVKATQRDLRRFNTLRTGLARLATSSTPPTSSSGNLSRRISTSHSNHSTFQSPDDSFDKITEPLSWAALAYNGYMWWASAGEQLRSEEQEEYSRDAALLADLTPSPQTPMSMPNPAESLASLASARRTSDEARLELAIIAYFHRLTTQMLSILSDLVDSADEAYPSEDEDSGLLQEGKPVIVDSRSVENMGLDVWSNEDKEFVIELMRTYFGRNASIEGKGVEVCGVRVC